VSKVQAVLESVVPMLALALAVSACSVGGGGAPVGFSTSYQTALVDGGVAPALRSVKGSGAGTGWVVGEQGLAVQLTAGIWKEVSTHASVTLAGLSTLDAAHAYAVELGGTRVLAWDGRAWGALGGDVANRAPSATWAASTKDVWVVGDGIGHWDGQAWSDAIPAGGGLFTAVAGSFGTDVWAVGPGVIQHFDGSAWTAVAAPTSTSLSTLALAAVWASSPLDAWIVGAQGTVLRGNAGALTLLATGTTKDLTAVTGTDANDVWVGGQDGILLHWNGASWSQNLTPTGRTINDLWTARGGDLLIVDDTGAVLRFTR
jgi:hypothetical protein